MYLQEMMKWTRKSHWFLVKFTIIRRNAVNSWSKGNFRQKIIFGQQICKNGTLQVPTKDVKRTNCNINEDIRSPNHQFEVQLLIMMDIQKERFDFITHLFSFASFEFMRRKRQSHFIRKWCFSLLVDKIVLWRGKIFINAKFVFTSLSFDADKEVIHMHSTHFW